MAELDHERLEEEFSQLPRQVMVAITARVAMRALPVFAYRRGFDYWQEGKRARYFCTILACYQIASFVSFAGIEMNGADRDARAVAFIAAVSAAFADSAALAAANAAVYAAYDASRSDDYDAADTTATVYAVDATVAAAYDSVCSTYAAAYTAADALKEDVRFVISVADNVPPEQRAQAIHEQPLWPQGAPGEIEKLWQDFQAGALALDSRFKIWLDWYRDRLDGKPFNFEVERQWAQFLGEHPDEFPPGLTPSTRK